MEQKHTPGPWAVCQPQERDPFTVYSQRPESGGNKWVCQGPNVGALVLPPSSEIEANARLIAAAPELLEALTVTRMSAGWQHMSDETRALIEAAIAKAS